MQSNKEKRAALIARAEAVSLRTPYTQADSSLFTSLMRLSDAMLVEAEPSTSEEARKASLRFRELLLSGTRSYTPLSTSADAQLIAQGFEAQVKNLMIADGPLFAGSPLLTNFYPSNMAPSKVPVADDTASSGFILVENAGAGADEAEISGFSSVTFGKKFFSTGIMLVSDELVQDVSTWTTAETLVGRTTAARLSRIQNSTWLAALKTALALNSSAAVAGVGTGVIAAQDVRNIVAACSAAYRPHASFVVSPSAQRVIGAELDGNGRPVYRHVQDPQPTLEGYPVHVIAAAATNDVLFGDFSFAMAKSLPLEVKTLTQRFAELGYLGVLVGQRADFQWSVAATSDSPVKYLTIS